MFRHPDPAATRFFVGLLPTVEIQDYANQVIEELAHRYHTSTAKAPPHVTLQPPFLWQLSELAQLEACLQSFAAEQFPVPVCLSGFGAFAPRVLYLNVLKTPELLALQAGLMAELESRLAIVDPVSKHRSFSPHLTIASRNVTRSTFRQAWADLKTRSIEFSFVANRFTLLIHDGSQWRIQSEFQLLQTAHL